MFSETSKKNAVKYIEDSITHICKNIGPRKSGSKKELEAQEWLNNEVDSNN